MSDCRLYLITPPSLDLAVFTPRLAEALEGGDVAALQVRLKEADEAAITAAVRDFTPLTRRHGVALILNDDPELAARLACDGVHVGQGDTPLAQARRVMGGSAMIGVTCHDSRHLAMEAADAGADYVAFGAFFSTATKLAPTTADPEILSIWQEKHADALRGRSAASRYRRRRRWRRPAPISWRSAPASGPILRDRRRPWPTSTPP